MAKNSVNSTIQFARDVRDALLVGIESGTKPFANKTAFERLAATYGIDDKNQAKELAEYGTLMAARQLIAGSNDVYTNLQTLIKLYEIQPNLTHRTSWSTIYQQYSTALPISYLAGAWANNGGKVFEPSAGNGLFTIAFNPSQIDVNEIDKFRISILEDQGFNTVTHQDASLPFPDKSNKYQTVISNPPFDKLDIKQSFDGVEWKVLDHLMAAIALSAMADNGKAAIIVGGHTKYDDKGRITAGKNRNFLTYLYNKYNVVDVININGELYKRQGTQFDIRLILIDGRANSTQFPPLVKDKNQWVVNTFDELHNRIFKTQNQESDMKKKLKIKAKALALKLKLEKDGLSGPYDPVAKACFSLEVNVPDSMDTEVRKANEKLVALKDVVEFVRRELQYSTREELCKSLAAEQIDAVAMAILKVKAGQAMIIGDQTGIGKGRQAAAIIRYACLNNKGVDFPVFITEKKNLFSDIYRDLIAIGSGDLKPFIVNSDVSIKDQNKKVLHKSNTSDQKLVYEYYDKIPHGELPDSFGDGNPLVTKGYDFIIATYSQFYNKKAVQKKHFLRTTTNINGIIIMDEAHNVSGTSDSGVWFQTVTQACKACIFLSATYAKRPDNMALYATKTTLKDIGADPDAFTKIMQKGGMALQEVVASKLAENGEMVRRERPYDDVEVNYLILNEKTEEHRAKCDAITGIIREIIDFENNYVMGTISQIDDDLAKEQKSVDKQNKDAGVSKTPLFSKVFQTIYQLLMAIKVDDVVDRAIMRLKSGYKVVIAFGNTMESFLNEYSDGSFVKNDFSEILVRALDGTLRYTVKNGFNVSHSETLDLNSLGSDAVAAYNDILHKIETVSSGITISPIDIMIQKLESAGYSVEEVTGRTRRLEFDEKYSKGEIVKRKKRARENQFLDFQNNEVDVLLINQSGSTGSSAHAIPTDSVPRSKVKPRAMLVLQPELDINKEIQKRGRINRTGQIHQPAFDYLVSNIPAETRLLMMLKNKLKSLDANTSGSTSTSKKMLDYDDIMNKYGDFIITQYCKENEDFSRLIGDPLKLYDFSIDIDGDEDEKDDEPTESEETNGDVSAIPEASNKVTGRVAIIPTTKQEEFYTAIFKRYREYVDSLRESGDYDLDVQLFDLKAKTLDKQILKVGTGTGSPFSGNSYLEKLEVNNLTPPLKQIEVEGKIKDCLSSLFDGYTNPSDYTQALITNCTVIVNAKLERQKTDSLSRMTIKQNDARNSPKLQEMEKDEAREWLEKKLTQHYNEYEQRATQLEANAESEINELKNIFSYYTPGKSVELVIESGQTGTITAKSVFIGYKIDFSATNPYAKSNIEMMFAGLEQIRTLTLTLSSAFQKIRETIGLNYRSNHDFMERWDELRKEAGKSRVTAYMITGNLISALAEDRIDSGNLVRFTDENNVVRIGYRLRKYSPRDNDNNDIVVPVYIARNFIIKRAELSGIELTKNIYVSLRSGQYTLSVPMSRTTGGEIYQDQDLLITAKTQFEKSSNFMVMYLDSADTLRQVLKHLQEKHNINVSVPRREFAEIEDTLPEDVPEITQILNETGITLPEVPTENPKLKLLRIRAKALAIKLKLLENQ